MKSFAWFLFCLFASMFRLMWMLLLVLAGAMWISGVDGAGTTALVGMIWFVGALVSEIGPSS